jgi:hypothetical protein
MRKQRLLGVERIAGIGGGVDDFKGHRSDDKNSGK